MEEISNKTLAILLIGAIVISLGGTLISLNRLARIRIPIITGLAVTDTAALSLTISALAEVNWTTDAIAWGTGYVIGGKQSCTLNSYENYDTANCSSFTNDIDGLVLENIGNKNVTLNISASNNAASFIGGSANTVRYQWNFSNLEPNSCPATSLEKTAGTWYTANTTETMVCNSTGGGFLSGDTADTLNFDVLVVIPSDALAGAKTSTITAGIVQI